MPVIKKVPSKTKGIRWQAIIRMKGYELARTFGASADAKGWARNVESAITNESPVRPFKAEDWMHERVIEKDAKTLALALGDLGKEPSPSWTLGKALKHYRDTVTVTKKGEKQETVLINAWRKREIADTRLDRVTPGQIQQHIDGRIASGRAPTTVRNEVMLLSALYRLARSLPRPGGNGGGWGLLDLENPVTPCALPQAPAGRHRRLEDGAQEEDKGEEERMISALQAGNDATLMVAVFTLAIETGMRLGEILDVRPSQIIRVRGARYVERPDSKNGHPRRVVLSTKAQGVIDSLLEGADIEHDRPLIRMDQTKASNRWAIARTRAGVKGLRMHDLRHEGLSRMAGYGLTIGELQAQSGHRTAQILLRYVNARPQDVAKKLG